MINVMFFAKFLSIGGGAERAACLWANLLADSGYNVTMLTFYPAANEYPLNEKIKRLYLYKSEKACQKVNKLFRMFHKIKLMKEIFKQYPQDVVIPFLFNSNILCALSAPKQTIVAQTIRTSPWHEPRILVKKLSNFLIKKRKVVVVQNREQIEYFKNFKNLKPYVVCNPVNPAIENVKKETYSNIKNIVTFGRLCKQKNQGMLIDAIDILKNKFGKIVNLDIYGAGKDEEKLRKHIQKKHLENQISLKGNIKDVFATEIKYDLFVMSSIYEGFPNALLEAMALGMPVISTNYPTGPKEMIDNGKNGYLLDSFEAEDLAKCIADIDDAKLLEKIGKQARIDMLKNFSKEVCAKQLNLLIDDLLKNKKN